MRFSATKAELPVASGFSFASDPVLHLPALWLPGHCVELGYPCIQAFAYGHVVLDRGSPGHSGNCRGRISWRRPPLLLRQADLLVKRQAFGNTHDAFDERVVLAAMRLGPKGSAAVPFAQIDRSRMHQQWCKEQC